MDQEIKEKLERKTTKKEETRKKTEMIFFISSGKMVKLNGNLLELISIKRSLNSSVIEEEVKHYEFQILHNQYVIINS